MCRPGRQLMIRPASRRGALASLPPATATELCSRRHADDLRAPVPFSRSRCVTCEMTETQCLQIEEPRDHPNIKAPCRVIFDHLPLRPHNEVIGAPPATRLARTSRAPSRRSARSPPATLARGAQPDSALTPPLGGRVAVITGPAP